VNALTVICLLLFMGAMGKSAQFLLHTWLPDAMEGPTPVSALIHAATMVTAGVFMVARLSPLFELAPTAKVVTSWSARDRLLRGDVGLAQNDIKRVIAYSTCSQLGYMFAALGVGAYSARHLPPVHARLLQGAAVPRRRLRDPRPCTTSRTCATWAACAPKTSPFTWAMMLIGTLALTGVGIPHLAGRRLPLQGHHHRGCLRRPHAPAITPSGCSSIAAFMTSFYSWRLMFMTFFGKHRAPIGTR
jgi:NADH-quinone oxidoreductase subunit L